MKLITVPMKLITVTIRVTQADIDEAYNSTTEHCAVRIALQRVVDPVYTVHMLYDAIQLSRKDLIGRSFTDHFADLPSDANEFVSHFDNLFPVRPFSFEVRLPEEALKNP